MPLINFQTDLTNLPWGRDKRDSGDSNQPYITKDIPTGLESDDLPVRSGPDFIVRGGLKMVTNAVDDVSRLFKMFTDTKNLSAGIGFIAKQNILSRTSVKTPASFGLGYAGSRDYYFENTQTGLEATGGGNINQGVYTPIGTLATALGNGLGVHANLLGLDPFSPMSGVVEGGLFQGDLAPGLSLLGLNTYEAATKKFNETADGNRLVIFNNRANEVGTDEDINIYSYSGGPGAVLGIGKTNIKFADQRTGAANKNGVGILQNTYQVGTRNRSYNPSIEGLTTISNFLPNRGDASNAPSFLTIPKPSLLYNSVSSIYTSLFGENNPFLLGVAGDYAIQTDNYGFYQSFLTDVNSLEPDDNDPTKFQFKTNPSVQNRNKARTFTQQQLVSQTTYKVGLSSSIYPSDFRKDLYTVPGQFETAPTEDASKPFNGGGSQQSKVLSVSPDYQTQNIDVRLNMGQPGKQGGSLRDGPNPEGKNVWNYSVPSTASMALDKLTAMPMYSFSNSANGDNAINDLVKFRIAAIDNNNPSKAIYMHFRAFINSMDDNYSAEWNPVKYAGRGDSLYNYQGFNRSINLSFTVAAQSKAELIPMYKKLNYLASTLSPSYNGAGFMRGNLVRLTIGGYLYEQPGFINSLTYTVPETAPWEISINNKGGSDRSVQELPHVIQVSGFTFTPIHTFLPSKPEGASASETEMLANNPGTGSNAGNQRFISLSRKVGNPTSPEEVAYNQVYHNYSPDNGSDDGDNQSSTEN